MMKADVIERGFEMSKQAGSNSFVMFGEEIVIKDRTVEDIKKEQLEKDKPSIILSGVRAAINLLRQRLDSDGIELMKIADPKENFLTSDNPVTVRDPNNERVVPANPSNFLSLPIDYTHTLLLIPERPLQDLDKIYRSKASFYSTLAWNFGTLKGADRFIMGSEDGLRSFSSTVIRINKVAGEP
jgi:hypothetical protein